MMGRPSLPMDSGSITVSIGPITNSEIEYMNGVDECIESHFSLQFGDGQY